MFILRFLILLFSVSILVAQGFNKFSMSKDKTLRANFKHPISRRILRFERAINFEDFPTPSEFPLYSPNLDFAKIRPEIPSKTKPSQFPDDDYMPESNF